LTASKTSEHPFLESRNELKAFDEGLHHKFSREATERISDNDMNVIENSISYNPLKQDELKGLDEGINRESSTEPNHNHLPICKSFYEPPNPFTFNQNDTWNKSSYCSSAPSSASFESFPMTPKNAGIQHIKRKLCDASFPEFIELSPNHLPFRTFGSESFELELDESSLTSDSFSSKCSDRWSEIPAELYLPSLDMHL